MYRYASVLAAVGLLVLSDPTHLIAADDPSKQGAAESDAEKALKERVEKLSAIATKVPNTVITCHTSDLKCDPGEIYISAASVSTILIDTKPNANKKKLTVQLSAGEYDANLGDICVKREYQPAPDKVSVALYKDRAVHSQIRPKTISEFLYGESTDTISQQSKQRQAVLAERSGAKYQEMKTRALRGDCQEQWGNSQTIEFLTFGRSSKLLIQIQVDDGDRQTIEVDIKYQRWFVDVGGVLVFSQIVDKELSKEAGSTNMTKVRSDSKKDKFAPETGAVLDFYRANYPSVAYQFGLATNGTRQPTYFLGMGYRLREVGAKALATVSVGVIAKQVLRFPGIKPGIEYPSDSSLLNGSTSYRFGPYIAFSFGFKFGDVQPADTTK